jgi:glycosyltransferase involved in cell wall biosynthesis
VSLPEVVGEAGLLFEPDSCEGLSAAGVRLLEHRDVCEATSAMGLARARRFGWRRTVAQTMDAYRAV